MKRLGLLFGKTPVSSVTKVTEAASSYINRFSLFRECYVNHVPLALFYAM